MIFGAILRPLGNAVPHPHLAFDSDRERCLDSPALAPIGIIVRPQRAACRGTRPCLVITDVNPDRLALACAPSPMWWLSMSLKEDLERCESALKTARGFRLLG